MLTAISPIIKEADQKIDQFLPILSCKMIKTGVVVLLCSVITLTGALQCYDCFALKNNDCYSPINRTSIPIINCSQYFNELGNQENLTRECVAYKEHHNETGQTFVGRHCIIRGQYDYCTVYQKDRKFYGYILDNCFTCTEDLCNSGTNSGIMFGVFSVVVSIFVIE